MKVVINGCYGGFSLSDEAFELYLERKGLKFRKEKSEHFSLIGYEYYSENGFYLGDRDIERNDPVLVGVVEELGEKANGRCADLKVIEIPDDVKWHVAEYDGWEHIAEDHRTWD